MPRRSLLSAIVVSCCLSKSPAYERQQPRFIRRLDGSKISVQEADSFAKKTLATARVTGAEIAVLDRAHLVWSAAYGLRRRDPELPMTPETTTWAASITKSVFATYVMPLVEAHQFDLDELIANQLTRPLNEYEPYRESASEIVHVRIIHRGPDSRPIPSFRLGWLH